MTYQPFLMAKYATGLDRSVQPWLTPEDSQEDLFDGYIYRGVWNKRAGYQQYATGQRGGSPYTESRIVVAVTGIAMTGVIDGINTTFTTVAASVPIARGTFVVTGSSPLQTLTDDGLGHFLLPSVNISGVTLANPCEITTAAPHGYTTGDEVILQNIGGTSQLNSQIPYTITVTGASTFTLDGIDSTNFYPYTSGGTSQKVAGTINYSTGAVTVTFALPPAALSTVTAAYRFYPGLPVMMVANFYTATNSRQLIVADTRNVNRYNPVTNRLDPVTVATTYSGNEFNFFSWTNYEPAAGTPRLLFANNKDPIQSYDGTSVTDYTYTLATVTTLSCLLMFQMKDRLILLRTIENGTTFGRRIRISGTGANSDVFDVTATGAGVIDIPDNSWIFSAAFNRDDLIIFTEQSTWILKYTGNDVVPFVLDKLDGSRGSGAPYSGISYLNQSTTVSPRGFISSDGYRVDRTDDKIPDYSFNDIDQTNFQLTFAGTVDEKRDHMLLHPSPESPISDRILVTNYEEFNYAVFRFGLSCMGTFIEAFDITWNDLLVYSNWAEMAQRFGSWDQFSYTKGVPFSIGGGHNGQIWRVNINGIEDNAVQIRNVTIIDTNTLRVETDFNNYASGDYIYLSGMNGMLEGNSKQGAIKSVVTPNYVMDLDIPTSNFSPYTFGGQASRVIPFESKTKKFNPFADKSQKVRCGYMYFYVTSSNTGLLRNVPITNITQANPAIITANNHQFETSQVITITGVQGMLQINSQASEITVIDQNTFSLNAVDSTAYGAYTGGGVAMGPEKCLLDVDVITNDQLERTQLQNSSLATIQNPYRVDCTPDRHDDGVKRWVKIYINQTARFIQFRVRNTQALSVIQIQAMMPGFAPVGRLI